MWWPSHFSETKLQIICQQTEFCWPSKGGGQKGSQTLHFSQTFICVINGVGPHPSFTEGTGKVLYLVLVICWEILTNFPITEIFAGTGAPADPVCGDFTWIRVKTQRGTALKWSIKAHELPGEVRGGEREKGVFDTAGIWVLEDKSKLSPKLVFFISHGEFIIFQGPRAHKHTPGSWVAICVLKPLVVRFLCWNRQSCFTITVHAVSSFLI